MRLTCFIIALSTLTGCRTNVPENIDERQFFGIANTLSKGWSEGDATLAASVFSEDAVYEEPPKKQFYKGRKQIFEFFGGEKGFELPMKMKWHNLSFNEEAQVGFGEYTFAMNNQYHGIVVIKIENGKIVRWREYQYRSALDWKTFTGESEFETAK